MPAYSFGRIFHVRLVFVGSGYLDRWFQYRHKVTSEADADENRPERSFWRVGANDRFPNLKFVELGLIASRKKLLHRFPKICFRFFDRSVAGIFARKATQVRAVGIAIDLSQKQTRRDPSSRFIGMLNRDDAFEHGAMVNVRQV